jgi:hypothetical protein
MAPGLDHFSITNYSAPTTAVRAGPAVELQSSDLIVGASASSSEAVHDHGVYYNPRLDPKNYLEGPLSVNPATRLRQMLARPGIVVSP